MQQQSRSRLPPELPAHCSGAGLALPAAVSLVADLHCRPNQQPLQVQRRPRLAQQAQPRRQALRLLGPMALRLLGQARTLDLNQRLPLAWAQLTRHQRPARLELEQDSPPVHQRVSQQIRPLTKLLLLLLALLLLRRRRRRLLPSPSPWDFQEHRSTATYTYQGRENQPSAQRYCRHAASPGKRSRQRYGYRHQNTSSLLVRAHVLTGGAGWSAISPWHSQA